MPEDSVRTEFLALIPLYDRLRDEVLFAVNHGLKAGGIKTHSVQARVKDVDSFLGKIERKGYKKPFEQTDDLVGLRIVCYFLSDIPKIKDILHNHFRVVKEEDKVQAGDVSSFGYMSVHHVCMLPDSHTGPRYDALKGLRFEIQTRTVGMDAWASISHFLAYKGEASIPKDLRRSFHALSGLFYLADKQFEVLADSSRTAATLAGEEIRDEKNLSRREVDRELFAAYLHEKYPSRQSAGAEHVSELVEELQRSGLRNFTEIDAAINAGLARAISQEEKTVSPNYFTDVGITRAALAYGDRRFGRTFPQYEIN